MTANFRPEVSTFSDNIVISYPLASMTKELSPHSVPIFVLSQTLLSILASQALRLGFLLRGGAAIGRLYHDSGVIFGDALVEAYRLESQIAIYRRVILSPGITSHPVGKTYTMEC